MRLLWVLNHWFSAKIINSEINEVLMNIDGSGINFQRKIWHAVKEKCQQLKGVQGLGVRQSREKVWLI